MTKFFQYALLLAGISLILSSCNSDSAPVDITDQVVTFDPANTFQVPQIVADDVARLGLVRGKEWHWDTPESWAVFNSKEFREVNLKFGENNEGECYVTRLGPGSATSNINRWLGQVGVEAMTAEEIQGLPKISLMGIPATLVTADGTFAVRGGEPKENYRIQGAIISTPSVIITVKMTGPKELLVTNEDNFKAFCASLDYR